MFENKKVISWSVIVLFLVLTIVYTLEYMKSPEYYKRIVKCNTNTPVEEENQKERSQKNPIQETSENIESNWKYEKGKNNSVDLWSLINSSWVSNSNTQTPNTESSTSERLASTNRILSWTTEFYGTLDIVNLLWEQPQYTLQDSKWNYFVYYWERLNFVQTVQLLGGNVYEMVTEREILQNKLFGDKVSYINLSTFKDSRVMMVIEIDGDVWLLQVPANQYHYTKDYLKSLFIQ